MSRDIENGEVDVVVVYKTDRLSRSLGDFTDLSKTFERHNVSFVSVTQQIDTSNAAGRMMHVYRILRNPVYKGELLHRATGGASTGSTSRSSERCLRPASPRRSRSQREAGRTAASRSMSSWGVTRAS